MLKTVVIPAAGLGKRVQKITNGEPKELLIVGGKPSIFYIFQEIEKANFSEIILIVNKNKKKLVDYCKAINPNINVVYQHNNKGPGDAILCAKKYLKKAFAVIYPDTLIFSKYSILSLLKDEYQKKSGNLIHLVPYNEKQRTFYEKKINMWFLLNKNNRVKNITSNNKIGQQIYFGTNRFIVNEDFLNYIKPSKKEENNLSEINELIGLLGLIKSNNLSAFVFDTLTFDIGSVNGYIEANNYLKKSLFNNHRFND